MPTPVTIPQGNASIPYDPDGIPQAGRTALTSVGTSVAASATDTAITGDPSTNDVPFIQRIQGVCTVAPTASGVATIEDRAGAGAVLLANIDLLNVAHVAGSVINLEFDTPLRGVADEAIVITTPANTGTWTWYVSGYLMDDRVV